ncbi:MAG: hypothetical protein A4E52_01583 [Pelotomaculum sp. PtaB.Bin013]|nr:MAG: hypothetical protein A4E52_01583 [Pelotomaculum sp. PtaB.Bin013]
MVKHLISTEYVIERDIALQFVGSTLVHSACI